MVDKICYSNNGLSYRWVPEDYIIQDGEVLFDDIPTADQISAAFSGYVVAAQKISVMSQILTLENLETPRRISEAILGSDNGWLASNRASIAALRAQL